MGNSSLSDDRRKHFGREDYWHSNPAGAGGNVHNTYHIHACVDIGEIQEILEGNLNRIKNRHPCFLFLPACIAKKVDTTQKRMSVCQTL